MRVQHRFDPPLCPLSQGETGVWCGSPNRRANITLLASLSLQGMGAAFLLEGSVDSTAFEIYIEQLLAPSLKAGQIVVMDNLIPYRKQGAASHRNTASQLLFLPSYSPDFSPDRGSVLQAAKEFRPSRNAYARRLQEQVGQALLTITPDDALGWFTHCGHRWLEQRSHIEYREQPILPFRRIPGSHARYPLHSSLGHSQMDAVVQEVIQVYEETFPGHIAAYYVEGSYADQTSLMISDLDLLSLSNRFANADAWSLAEATWTS